MNHNEPAFYEEENPSWKDYADTPSEPPKKRTIFKPRLTKPNFVVSVLVNAVRLVLLLAVLCGLALAAVCFAKVLFIDRLLMGNETVSLAVDVTVCLTLGVTVVVAKIVGCSLPLIAKRLGFDPAVMASPFITTIVDAMSLLLYFLFAKSILHV